jgi:hypothetical protein
MPIDDLEIEAEPPVIDPLNFVDDDLENQLPAEGEQEITPFVISEEEENLPNLVELFESHPEGKTLLKKIVQDCRDEFTTSWDKNQSYREKTALSWRLLYCDLPPKNKPFENCANVAIPLALQNVVRYTNKIQTEIFGDWSNVFNFIPTNPNAELIAPIVSEHSNWQIRNRITGFKRQMARAVLTFAVGGDVVCHSYYDSVTRRNCHEILTCDDFVTPFTHISVAPDFSDVPWIARRIPFFKTKLRAMSKEWSHVEDVIKQEPPEHGNPTATTELRDTIADHLGEDSFGQQKGEYEIIHYEGWIKLPGQKNDRYCQLIFDLTSQHPLKFAIHESAGYHERYRYQYQMNEMQEYQMAQQQYQMMLQGQQQQAEQAFAAATMEPVGSLAAPMIADQGHQILNTPPPEPPAKPNWMIQDGQTPIPPRKEPIHMFSHGVCLEPMLGNLGIGIGRIDSQLNLGTNTLWSQFIDAATLGNGKTFITASNVDFRSPFKIGPGVFNKAKNVMPSDLQNAFYELEFGGANPQLLQAADQLMQFGEQASSTPELMSGGAGKSGETARGIQERVAQMNSMFQVPTMNLADFVIQIMRNNCKLNRTFLGDEEIFYVNRFNDDLQMSGREMVKAAREMYDNEYEIELVRDLQFTSRAEKVSRADEILQLPNAMPELQMNMALKYAALQESLRARGLFKMARKLLGPPPAPPITTFGLPFGTPGTSAMMPDGQVQQFPPPMPPPPGAVPPGQEDPNQGEQQQ